MASAGLISFLAGTAAIILILLLRPVPASPTTMATPIYRAGAVKRHRGVRLLHLNPSAENASKTDTGIDIIAIHGLDTRSPETWEYKKEDGQKTNWLADQDMLPAQVPGTRIYTCDWPADLFETEDSVPFEIEELAVSLLQGILGSDTKRDRQILFIASCLGGVILMKALVEAKGAHAAIREATRGIIFLATPFRGTFFKDISRWAQPGLKAWASIQGQQVTKLLGWVNSPTFDLVHLVSEFTKLRNDQKSEAFIVHTFYETRYTFFRRKVPFVSWLLPLSKKLLVEMDSATLDCVPTTDRYSLDLPHVLMNKFSGPSDPNYEKVVHTIQRLLTEIQTGTPLAQADAWIRNKHYDKQRLMIERLSGDPLEMDQCYINLALVETKQADIPKEAVLQLSPFSLSERLKLETPHESLRVELPNLFQPRKMPNRDTNKPRRILIRGHAGVGKTTLCKKIAHDFVHKGMWQDLFKRVVWVRLRDLKYLSNNGYNLGGMLEHIFFRQHENGKSLGHQMWNHIEGTKAQDTVFLLDGLDEVTHIIMEPGQRPPHLGHELLKGLLNRPNVIITTRPHAAFPRGFQPLDLDLDTIGFSPDQVQRYIKAVMTNDKDSDAIQAYLQKNRIMQNLVQIPIQLDALCFTWQASSIWNNSSTAIPETMTAVYEAMTRELWKKDNERLEKDGFPTIGNSCPAETNPFDSNEYNDLGYLAFSGLCSNVIEFQPYHRNALYRQVKKDKTSLSLDETFARLSFLRTSDPSMNSSRQSFHFIHLTFQEYFSAKHFVKAWKDDQELRYTELDDGKIESRSPFLPQRPREFLQKHKYTPRYNIMWRFVAGLLDAEGIPQITSFFEAIESEPVDLLGPTHQRLVMHCVAEVVQSVDLRTELAEQLSQWVEFECNFRSTSRLISETELPAQALNLVLERASEEVKMTILDSLSKRQSLPLETIELVTSWLEGIVSQQLRHAALKMLSGSRERLPSPTLNAVIPWMDDKDRGTKQYAAWTLRSQNNWPEDVLRDVMARAESQDADIKQRAAEALQGQSTLPKDIIRTIALWLEDRDPSTRFGAFKVLLHQSKLPECVIEAIAAQLRDQDEFIRLVIFEVLQDQPKLPRAILDDMMARLHEQDDDMAEYRLPSHRDQLPDNILQAVTLRLKTQDSNIRQKAIRALKCGNKQLSETEFSDDVFQVMVSWLGEDRATRQMALEALSSKRTLPEGVLKAVAAQLEDEDGTIREAALKMLGELWRQRAVPDDVRKAVEAQLNDQDGAIREVAMDALRKFGSQQPLPNDTIRAIAAQLEEKDNKIVCAALEALQTLGSRQVFPEDVLKAVAARLKDQDPYIRGLALQLLPDQAESSENIPQATLVTRLENDSWQVRCSALEILEGRPSLDQDTLSRIAAELRQNDRAIVRLYAAKALASQKRLSEDILLVVTAQLEDRDVNVRMAAINALRSQTELTRGIQEALLACRTNPDSNVRSDVMEILRKQPGLSKTFLTAVVPWMEDEDWYIREEAVRLLGTNPTLPYEILQVVTARLEDGMDLAVAETLRGQRSLPDTILKSEALYPIWLERCFEEHIYCYIEDEVSYLELPAGLGRVPLSGQLDGLRKAIRQRQRELGMPI
ncbi:hypothetical protein J7T55_003290 [Diaporthe amygdali]|uniref:uncharacterized protein n=1 Tax=Phomopsis amygdali TaxID=1214568 RepID=UPI0022FEB06B|nr:uncharacterized protein J7T55_003290 [Diaporthe amygdali]KAJ0122774.1 hypothetical protein J7T55_003290 [Diaporthe amygdali]